MTDYYKQESLFELEERLDKLEAEVFSDQQPQFESYNLSHKSVEYGTPIFLIEAARGLMGSIDLDPASSSFFNQFVKAEKIFTEADEGLSRAWYGNILLNAPYSKKKGRSNQEIWNNYLIAEHNMGHITQGVSIIKSALSYDWFERLWDNQTICFIRRRPSFIKPDGSTDGHASQGAAVMYVGRDVEKFISFFSEHGKITTPDGRFICG